MCADDQFDFNVIKQCLEHLGPDRFRLTFVAKEIAEDLPNKERWYGTEYSCEPLSARLIQVLISSSIFNCGRPLQPYLSSLSCACPIRTPSFQRISLSIGRK